MAPKPPKPHLPPLPPSGAWSTYFPRKYLAISPTEPVKVLRGRILLANKAHCDAFVRDLGLRKGEVVLDVNCGPGQLTRSLLNGGRGMDDAEAWKAWEAAQKIPASANRMGRPKAGSKAPTARWPPWPKLIVPSSTVRPSTVSIGSKLDASAKASQEDPAVVIATEASTELLRRGFNWTSQLHDRPFKMSDLEFSEFKDQPYRVERSPYHPDLIISDASAYRWRTLPSLLSDPLVEPYLAVERGGGSGTGDSEGKRAWEDEPPNITVVATIPDSVIGEQMLAQWIGSAAGGVDSRHWIWQWGRVRLAILCGRGLYDRVMSRPRESIQCKLSVMASALFHRRPIHPYHHVGNVDKSGSRTTSFPIRAGTSGKRIGPDIPPIVDPSEGEWEVDPTTVLPGDIFPPTGTATSTAPMERPPLLGIMLTPRLSSVVIPKQKDAWDYVLRNCFIREAQPISEQVTNLGFGAGKLISRMADSAEGYEKRWRGVPVDPNIKAKDLSVEEWARVVDVFDKWAFKPDNLLLDTGSGVEASRELGVD